MKYLVLSDLHHDAWLFAKRDPFAGIEEEIASLDFLLLAGDVSNKPKRRWKPAFVRLAEMIDPAKMAVFTGNHDYYDFRIDDDGRLAEIAAEHGAAFVNRSSLLRGGIRFICATLWTDFELGDGRTRNESFIPTRMNDYRYIRNATAGYRRMIPQDSIAIHHDLRAFISDELAKPHDGPTIVVTHHAPHPDVLGDHAENLDAAYASDLTEVIQSNPPDAWLFGHSHDENSIEVAGCKIQNVSLGYPEDVPDPAARMKGLIRST